MGSRVFRNVKFTGDKYPIPAFPVEIEEPEQPEEPNAELAGGETEVEEAPPPEPAPDLEEIKRVAAQIVSDAEKQKEELLNEARREAVKIKEEAFNNGRVEGIQQGVKEGKDSLRQETEALRADFHKLAASLKEEKSRVLWESEPEVVDLAMTIARGIVKEELQTNRAVVLAVAKEALMRLSRKEGITIRVNPEEYELIGARKTELIRAADLDTIRFVPDARVERGGCIVDSSGGQIDGRIEVQFDKMKQMIEKLKSEARPPTPPKP